MSGAAPIADDLVVPVGRGERVLVFSGLRMAPGADDTARDATRILARTIEECRGPAVMIFAGDTFDFLHQTRPDPDAALAAHPRLVAAIEGFLAGANRRVIVLPGTRDSALAYDARVACALRDDRWEIALACTLEIDTGSGHRVVRVEAGQRYDAAAAYVDPCDPNDHPLAVHLEREVLPALVASGGSTNAWLAGVEDADAGEIGSVVASRFTYRRLFRRAAWLTLPVLGLLAAFFPIAVMSSATKHTFEHIFRLLVAGFVIEVGIVLAALVFVVVQLHDSVGSVSWLSRAMRDNDDARAAAVGLVAAGESGLVSAHTGRAELTDLGAGTFFANCGTAGRVVERVDAWFGLPPIYAARLRCSWIEIESGADLHVRLWSGARELPEQSFLERAAMRRRVDAAWPPVEVAAHPGIVSWPPTGDATAQRRRTRRIAAAAIAFAGLINIISAVTVPVASRLRELDNFTPIVVPQAAAALVAMTGMGLILLALGIRRGQRHAWILAIALLFVSSIGNVIKGLDVEEAIVALGVMLFLIVHRDDFEAPANLSSWRRALWAAAIGVGVAIVAGTIGIAMRGPQLSLGEISVAVGERLVGVRAVALPDRIDDVVSPALLAVGIAIVLTFFWLLFRPAVAPRLSSHRPVSKERARFLVERHGTDSLAYFALRDDKEWFGFRDTLVAYGVHNGVALVSPDPIGPVGQRAEAWRAFREFADDQGWNTAVMGVSAEWLPVYRASGMHDLYIGDEAVVDVRRFSLDGKQNKSLRQSVSRVEKLGYRVEFFDPSALDPPVQQKLRGLMAESRRGDVERGFSMTLGRAFEPDDRGLLLAVAFDSADEPVGFCQYVPARSIEGWSLDLMRRSETRDVPNGLTEFIVVKTIEHARAEGAVGVALNFATFRAVLASEAGDRLMHRAQKWFLERMSDSLQIESLWTFNEKFSPEWHPRYAVYDTPEHVLSASIAVARAESFFEIPIIGRFFRPADDARPEREPEPTATGG